MKQLNNMNRTINLVSVVALTLALGSPITAMAGKRPSLSQLSTQIENLTKQFEALQLCVNGQGITSQHVTMKNNPLSRNTPVGMGRNKSRTRKTL